MTRAEAVVRLAHPFPTLLNAVAAATLTAAAGGGTDRVLLAAGTMLGVHASIGAINDLVDERVDAHRREKPLARGRISRGAARFVAALAAALGVLCATALGPVSLAIAGLGYGLGCAYDLGIKRTVASFVPFALGVALVPPFAWAAAGAPLPTAIASLSLAALPAGSALALQNGLADRALDAAAGVRGLVVRLGASRATLLAGVLHGAALLLVAVAAPIGASRSILAAGGTFVLLGVGLSARGSAARRRRGWECSAVGLSLCAVGTALAA
jgi:4-hydroxybenzoate polyprenyltransferase